jgi:HD-GYP domain-containing protein (c-di-GMP phosphodiesterase class II)
VLKVTQLRINHTFHHINPDILAKDETVPFDIYIKRFNDFVIIIEAGTLLDDHLLKQLVKYEMIYVKESDSKKLENYSAQHSVVCFEHTKKTSDPISEALKVTDNIQHITDPKRKLFFIYSTTSELLKYLFDKQDEHLHREALYSCVHEIMATLQIDINIMPTLLTFLPQEYSTHHHSTNVAFFAAIIGHKLEMDHQTLFDLIYAGLLHDIGKIRIDAIILNKPSFLDDHEFELVQQHAIMGASILEKNGITNQTILKGVKHHHERLDGSGYPDRLKGKMIPKVAKILGMCDVFDALTTKRTFRKNYTSFEALLMMKQEMNTQFDESLIDLLIKTLR